MAPVAAEVRGATPPPAAERTPQPKSASWRITARVVISLLLGGALPVVMLGPTSQSFSPAFFVQCLVIFHAAVGLSLVLTARQIRIVQFGFWTFTYVWMGLAPLAMLITGRFPWALFVDLDTAFRASTIIELGLLAYTVGVVLAQRSPKPTVDRLLPRALSRQFDSTKVVALAVLAVGISLVLLPRLGGLEAAFDTRVGAGDARSTLKEGVENSNFQLMRWAILVSIFWSMVALFRLRPLRSAPHIGLLLSMLLAAAVAMNVILNNPISMPRYWAGTVWLTLLFSLPLLRRVGPFRGAAAAVLLSAAVLFPYSDYFRYEETDIRIASVADQLSRNGDYDAYQQLGIGLYMVDDLGHSPSQALVVPFAWVPRSSWEGKPEALGQTIAAYAGYDFTNLSAPLWIESYVWGGFPVLVAVFVGLGWLSARLDQISWAVRHRDLAIAGCLIPALAIFQIFLLRGSLLPAIAPLALIITVPFLISSRPDEPSLSDHPPNAGNPS